MSLRTRLLLAFAVVLALALGGNYVLNTGGARETIRRDAMDKAEAVAELVAAGSDFAGDLPGRVEDVIGMQMVVQATLAAHLVDVAENRAGMDADEVIARLKDIAEHTVLDEFWITDEGGHAYLRNQEEIDFTFPREETEQGQAHAFSRLLAMQRGQVIQNAMPREYDQKVYKYAGVSGLDKPRIVQVGYQADSLAALTQGMTSEDLWFL